jgi:glutamyl/glutaminyl-tRNA synthetase
MTEFSLEGFLNFLALLGWNDGTEQEIFTVEELISKFSIAGIGKSGANFDQKRLEWINGHHIRLLKLSKLYKACDKFWPSKAAHTDREYRKEVLIFGPRALKVSLRVRRTNLLLF